MSIALKGFITGLAKGAEEKFDEEREQTRKVIAARTQNAYKNYLTYQEQRNSLIEEVKKRDALALQFQGDLTDEERISLATMPNALELYQKALEDGKDVKLRDIIKVGDKAKGMKYEDFVKTLGVVQPAAQGMQFKAPESFFGTSVEKQQKFAQQLAETAGTTPETLAAFEQPVEKPMMAPMGSIDTEFMQKAAKAPTSQKEMLDKAQARQTQAKLQFGEKSEEYKAARQVAEAIKADMEIPVKSLEDRAQSLRNRLIDAQRSNAADQENIIKDELKVVESNIRAHKLATSTKDEAESGKTVAAISSSIRAYVGTRMRLDVGASWYKYTRDKTIELPNGQIYTFREKKEEMPLAEQQKMFAQEREFAKQGLIDNGYINKSGIPAYSSVQEVMNNLGLSGSMPAAPQAAPTPTAAAQPAAQPPVAASAAQAGQARTRTERTRAEVEAVVKDAAAKGIKISYEEAKAAAERQGLRVIE